MNKGERRRRRAVRRREFFYDYNLLAVVIILICFGLVMLYSASSYEAAISANIGDDMFYFRRQAVYSLVAVGVALLFSSIDYHFFISAAPALYVLAFVLMAMVRFTPFGVTVFGARRWLNIAGFQFQPSETAKIAIIFMMTYMILKFGRRISEPLSAIKLLLLGALQGAGAYVLTDNLSTGIIIFGISLIMVYLTDRRTWPYVAAGGGLVAGMIAARMFLGEHLKNAGSFRLRRILVWIQPEKYLKSGGYQVMQGLYAIGSGGFFGKGLGNSTQKLSTIPEAQNDMIFTIICEELGLFGAILLLILFAYLLYRLFVIAQNAPDLSGTLIASGVFAHIALQVILNICVVLNIIPTTGVTLPFVSYGGTSVVFLMIEIGIVLGVARKIPTAWEKGEEVNEHSLSE